jgi:HAD superfamily hydrolase (TIGR01509 family)
MIRAIIFDIGGVLITPAEKITPFILSQMFPIPLEEALKQYLFVRPQLRNGSLKTLEFMQQIQSQYPTTEVKTDFEKIYTGYYSKQAIINEDLIKLIEMLSKKYLIVACSNMSDLHVKVNRQRNLFKYFHHVYLSSEIGLVKPDIEMFRRIFTDLKLNSEECVFIDDKLDSINVGKNLNMKTYLFDSVMQLSGFLQKEEII